MFRVGKCLSTQNRAGNRRPSLNLNFQGGSLDSRVTFSRTSNATLTGSNGLIQYAPHNLLTYSEQFDNAAWTKQNITVAANNISSPDGTTNADKISSSSNGVSVSILSNSNALSASPHTQSWHVKYGTQRYIQLLWSTALSAEYVNIDLQTMTIVGGTYTTAPTITLVSDGWYRVTLTSSVLTASGSSAIYFVNAASSIRTASYTGAVGTYVYIWGAQLNVGSLQPYYPTTTTAYYGPRFDYDPITLACKGLLIEEQRVNLLTYSEQINDASWTKNNATVTANAVVAPDGTLTADKLVESNTNSTHYTNKVNNLVNGTTYTLSCFFKKAERSFCYMQLPGAIVPNQAAVFNLTNGTVGNVRGTPNATIIPFGDGWYKCSISGTATSTADTQIQIFILDSNRDISVSAAYQGDGTSGIYIWGAQLEAGAFATSYIPTVASQVTRTADNASMTGTNFSSWFNNAEGTLYGEVLFNTAASSFQCPYSVNDGTNSNRIQAYQNSSLTSVGFDVTTGLVSQASINVTVSNITTSAVKQAGAYQVNNVNTAANGALGTADTNATLSTYTQLLLGRNQTNSTPFNGTIKSISYYPRRLTNAELQAITA